MDRRRFLKTVLALAAATLGTSRERSGAKEIGEPRIVLLTGDVMTGRGIDQILPHPSSPQIHERYMQSALGYVELAERAHGRIPRPASFDYIWGDSLAAIDQLAPDLTLINLETAITTSDDWMSKGINYRMNPKNAPCLRMAKVSCCALANNHVLDWGEDGLNETLATLHAHGILTAGAGQDAAEANSPAMVELGSGGRALVFGVGVASSGIPETWAASANRPGVHYVEDLSPQRASELATTIETRRRPGDIVIVSIHWGGNWGYGIPPEQRSFAHRLVDEAGVDIVHGHSSHHAKGIEVYHERLILYGCGDFLNDYEGIGGREQFRSDLVLLYVVKLHPSTGSLLGLTMLPFQIRRFRLRRPPAADVTWMKERIDSESRSLGCRVQIGSESALIARWG